MRQAVAMGAVCALAFAGCGSTHSQTTSAAVTASPGATAAATKQPTANAAHGRKHAAPTPGSSRATTTTSTAAAPAAAPVTTTAQPAITTAKPTTTRPAVAAVPKPGAAKVIHVPGSGGLCKLKLGNGSKLPPLLQALALRPLPCANANILARALNRQHS